jgi:hypothetical protein
MPERKKALPRGKASSLAPTDGAGSELDLELLGDDGNRDLCQNVAMQ